MSKHIIFGGIMAAIALVMIGASLMTDKTSHEKEIRTHIRVEGDSLVITETDGITVIYDKDKVYRCAENGGSVTVTRDDGSQVTVSCE